MTAKGLRRTIETLGSLDTRLVDRELFETVSNDLPLSELEATLRRHGMRDEHVSQILERTFGQRLPLDRMAAKGLVGTITFDAALPRSHKYVAFVGPEGAGKTATLLKLAAQLRAAFELEIGFVSCVETDPPTICALRRFSKILNMPYRKVGSFAAIAGLTRDFESCDLVLIDTPSDITTRDLRTIDWIEKLVVIPATQSYEETRATLDTYESVGEQRLILSKVDLACSVGPSVSAIVEGGKPLALITTGQRVPDDIEPASARRLGWMLTRTIH